MELRISSQFAVDLKSQNDSSLREKVKSILETIKMAPDINHLPHFRRINGHSNAYKVGIGFYYIVVTVSSENEVTLLRLLDRDQVLASIK